MRRKKLPKNKHKGMSIYCSQCSSYFTWTSKKINDENGKLISKEPLCGKTKKNYSTCKFFEKHKYRVRVYISGKSEPISKTLLSQTYNEAVVESIDFRNEINNNNLDLKQEEIKLKRVYLVDAQAKYLDYLCDVGVPAHKKKNLSSDYISFVDKALSDFNKIFLMRNQRVDLILLNKVIEDDVGYFHRYLLEDLGHKPSTYNNKMTYARSFFTWAIENFEGLNMRNPFKDLKLLDHIVDVQTITEEEFKELLNRTNKENGVYFVGNKKEYRRNAYRPYLVNAFKLALHTGGRREEIATLKWSMVRLTDGKPMYLEVPNLKVLRKKGEGYNKKVPPKIIPITKDLKEILFDMGAENNIGKDEYILERKPSTSIKTIMEKMTVGFKHYYSQLNTGREITFAHLRKTYLTYLKLAMGSDTKAMSSHATDEVLNNHYIDFRIIAKATEEFTLFK